MATDRQITANRDNAKLSTGPRTEAGLAASSRNHTTHNLTAKGLIILPGLEDDFAQLQTGLLDSLQPDGQLQQVLFARILECSWNLQRCRLAEHQLYQSCPRIDPLLDDVGSPTYDRIQKYARQYESGFHKALRTLGDLQTEAAYRQQVAPVPQPLTEDPGDTRATVQECLAIPHARSEVCRSQKIDSGLHRQQPKTQPGATVRHQLASNWKDRPAPHDILTQAAAR